MPSLPRCLRRPLSLVALFLSPLAALAVTPANRIASVDSASRGSIAHNIAGRIKASTDLGQAPSDRRMEGITLFFSRTAAQQTALDQLQAAQQTPGSPQYHKWLTPTQFGQQFGLSAADLAKVQSWLTNQGLTVSYVAPSNSLIVVGGTVAQVQRAFGTSIHSLLSHGEQHIGNVSDPVLPAAIANVVSGIGGLNDFKPHSHARLLAPAYTSGQSGSHYLVPGDFQVIYDSKPLLSAAVNGSGATIAVIGQTNLSLPDVATFRTLSGLPAQAPQVLLSSTATPSNNTADITESQLDVEWAGATAPNAQIVYITDAGGAFNALYFAITQQDRPVLPIISISYGSCESNFAPSDIASYDNLFQQANLQGQTILASSGDSGATDCDESPNGPSLLAADGLAVDFPASSPFVTGIGGTMFNDTSANWQASNGAADQVVSALGYIPETVWNEYTANTPNQLAAGGGGVSIYHSKPTWQVGNGVPNDSSRDVPDIALNAAFSHVGYLVCIPALSGSADTCTNGFRNASGLFTPVGGTSAGTPSFAGILALIQQQLGATSGLGNINPILYGLGGTAAFHDVTTGSNASPCVHGSPDCQSASSIGYSAAPGYDRVTGLGSIDAYNLATTWKASIPAGGTSTTGTAISITTLTLPAGNQSCGITAGSFPVTVQVTALQSGSVPTGAVQLLVDGSAVGTAVPLTNAAANLVVTTAGLSSGAHSIEAVYTGDAVYGASKSFLGATLFPAATEGGSNPNTVVDIVSSTSPDFSLTPCVPNITVASGGTSAPVTLTATAFNGFSGPVTFTASTDANLIANYTLSASSATVSPSAPGTTTLTFSAFTTSSNARSATGMKRIPSKGSASQSPHDLLGVGAGTAVLASLFFFILPRRRRVSGLFVLVFSMGVLAVSGCGSGAKPIDGGTGTGTGGTITTPTASGTYIVNITASGNNSAGQALVHTSYVTLTVTQ